MQEALLQWTSVHVYETCYDPSGVAKKVKLDLKALQAFRELGRIGGKKGGKLRWEGVSAEARRAHARKAARARWRKT